MKKLFFHSRRRALIKMKDTNGFSLLEVLISVAILAIIITPILAIFTSAFQTAVVSQNLLDGAYIAQEVYESLVADDYSTILSTSAAKELYDSDGDGTDDCYIQRTIYPDGVFPDLSSTDSPSYLHINVVDEQIYIFGTSGTDDSPNSGTQITSLSDITITNSSSSATVTVRAGLSSAMTFSKKYNTCPLVVMVNIYKKKLGTQTINLTISGDTSVVHVVEYARKSNFEELNCSNLASSNIYYGVNDYNTSLFHANIQVFNLDNPTSRIGYIEGTFEVSLP